MSRSVRKQMGFAATVICLADVPSKAHFLCVLQWRSKRLFKEQSLLNQPAQTIPESRDQVSKQGSKAIQLALGWDL